MSLEPVGSGRAVLEAAREIPVAREVDVVVAGGGPAGIAAAVAAARQGASTLLVERYGYLGGMMTGSWVTMVLGMGDGERQVIRGIAQEFRDRLAPLGGCSPVGKCGGYKVDAEMFQWLAITMLEEAGAQILLHSLVCGAAVESNCVRGLIVESKSGRQAILAKVAVDATADGDLAHLAGARCEKATHDVSLRMSLAGVDQEKVKAFQDENPQRFDELIGRAKELAGGVMPGTIRHVPDVDVTDASALTAIEIELRKAAWAGVFFLRENVPGYEDARLANTAPQLGVRESRRIVGQYTLTDEDILASRRFPDSIGRSGVHMDGYKLYDVPGIEYDIPYRCLVPESVDGLLASGRCVSTGHEAHNTLRILATCILTGQAAGVAAALAASCGVQPRALPIATLQDALKGQGAYLGPA